MNVVTLWYLTHSHVFQHYQVCVYMSDVKSTWVNVILECFGFTSQLWVILVIMIMWKIYNTILNI